MLNRIIWNFETGDAGLLSSRKLLPFRSIAWAILLFAITLGFFFASILTTQWIHLPKGSDYATAIVFPLIAFCVYAVLVKVGEHRRALEVTWDTAALRELSIGFAGGLVMITCVLLMLCAIGLYSIHVSHWTGWLNSFVFDSYISGMLEELAFRAILLRLFARAFGPLTGLILSSLLFGLAHLSHGTWINAAEIAFNGGLVMGLLYMVTGRLWMSIGMHIGWDFTEESILGVNNQHGLFLSVPDVTKSTVLTGGAYGPDGSLLAVLIGSIAIFAILYAQSKGWIHSARAILRRD